MNAPTMPTRPQRPTKPTPGAVPRRDNKPLEIPPEWATPKARRKTAYRLGAAARYPDTDNAGCDGIDLKPTQREAASRGYDEIDKQCTAFNVPTEERERLHQTYTDALNTANFPPDAIHRVFVQVRKAESNGVSMAAPFIFNRAAPQIYPRLFWAIIILGFVPGYDLQSLAFPFACNAAANEYSEVFGQPIYPTTVNHFIKTAVLNNFLLVVKQGTKGIHGVPSLFALTNNASPDKWNIPIDMLLRFRWLEILNCSPFTY